MNDTYTYSPEVQSITSIVHDAFEASGNPCERTFRNSSPNPYYGVTEQGFILEWYYGTPSYIHTTDGKVDFTSPMIGMNEDQTEKMMEVLVERLGLKLLKEEEFTTGMCGGVVGPFYRVTHIDGQPLPEVISRQFDGREPSDNEKLSNLGDTLRALLAASKGDN